MDTYFRRRRRGHARRSHRSTRRLILFGAAGLGLAALVSAAYVVARRDVQEFDQQEFA